MVKTRRSPNVTLLERSTYRMDHNHTDKVHFDRNARVNALDYASPSCQGPSGKKKNTRVSFDFLICRHGLCSARNRASRHPSIPQTYLGRYTCLSKKRKEEKRGIPSPQDIISTPVRRQCHAKPVNAISNTFNLKPQSLAPCYCPVSVSSSLMLRRRFYAPNL